MLKVAIQKMRSRPEYDRHRHIKKRVSIVLNGYPYDDVVLGPYTWGQRFIAKKRAKAFSDKIGWD